MLGRRDVHEAAVGVEDRQPRGLALAPGEVDSDEVHGGSLPYPRRPVLAAPGGRHGEGRWPSVMNEDEGGGRMSSLGEQFVAAIAKRDRDGLRQLLADDVDFQG